MSTPAYQPLRVVGQPATITQRYTIDYETIGRMKGDIWPAVDELISRVQDPRWSRARACWGCNNWTALDGLAHLPFRPGAGSNAVQTCTSCHYAKLDEVHIDSDTATDTLDAMKALREGWRATLSTRKPRKDRPRTLTLDSVQHQQGFAGKRTDRMKLHVEKGTAASSFRQKPNNPNERIDCPWCGEKNGARVERYTRIKPKEPDVRYVAIACLVGTCGKHWNAPGETSAESWPVYKKGEQPAASPQKEKN